MDKSRYETESDAPAEPDGTGEKLNAAEGDKFLNHTTLPEFHRQNSTCNGLECRKTNHQLHPRVQELIIAFSGEEAELHCHQPSAVSICETPRLLCGSDCHSLSSFSSSSSPSTFPEIAVCPSQLKKKLDRKTVTRRSRKASDNAALSV